MAVLVTGGAGYIGSHTVVALHDSGREVVVVDNLSNSTQRAVDALRELTTPDLVFVELDLCDRRAVSALFSHHDIDSVVHFAALKAVSESVKLPLEYYFNNLMSTIVVLQAMVDYGVNRFVFSSSCTVYGQPDEIPVTEKAPTGAQSPYGHSKHMCEQILADAADAADINVVSLRYFNPVGAHHSSMIGEDPLGIPNNLVPRLMQVADRRIDCLPVYGGDYDTPDGTAIRDYLHVVDLAEAHVLALGALSGGLQGWTAVNVGTGVGSSVLEVIDAAELVIGSPVPYEIVDRREGDIAMIWADPGLAEQVLGWRSTRTLNDMLRDHWNWQCRCES